MDLIQKIKEQGNQASVLLPGVAASNEVITVNIEGLTQRDDRNKTYSILDPAKTQIIDWAKGEAKFLRLIFRHMGYYGSVLFTRDAASETGTDPSDYGRLNKFYIVSNVSRLIGTKFMFTLYIYLPSASASFEAHTVNTTAV